MEEIKQKWQHWQYKNTFLLVVSLGVYILLARNPVVVSAIKSVGLLGYGGAVIAGFFFVSIFTALPASAVLYDLTLSPDLDPVVVILLGASGAMIGDVVLVRIIKEHFVRELSPLFRKFKRRHHVNVLFRSPYFSWAIPLIGALFVASPLPDEIGIGMLGISRIGKLSFLFITFGLNALGILLLVSFLRI